MLYAREGLNTGFAGAVHAVRAAGGHQRPSTPISSSAISRLWLAYVAAVGCSAGQAIAQQILPVAIAPGFTAIRVTGVSDEGVVGGFSVTTSNQNITTSIGFRWTRDSGRVDLPAAGSLITNTVYVSGDGASFAGNGVEVTEGPVLAFRQRVGGGVDWIAPLPGYEGQSNFARSLSRDGERVVGYSNFGFSEQRSPWIWSAATGTQPIPPIPGVSSFMEAADISDDGRTVVGVSSVGAWLWRDGVGTVVVPPPPGMFGPLARTISGDGRVVGGAASGSTGLAAVIWRDGVGSFLGSLGDFRSAIVTDVSDNGSVVVGLLDTSLSGQFERGFVWTASAGMLFLEDYLIAQGVSVPTDVRLVRPVISGDGLTIAGGAASTNPAFPGGAFVALIPAPAPACLLGLGLLASTRRRRH